MGLAHERRKRVAMISSFKLSSLVDRRVPQIVLARDHRIERAFRLLFLQVE